MPEDIKKQLISIYEENKGKKGSFMHILAHYQDTIEELHERNHTILMIVKSIENDLEYTFGSESQTGFYRALRSYIKTKIKTKKIANEKKHVVIDETQEKEEVTSNRSDLLADSDDSTDVKKLFEPKEKK